MQIKTRKRLIDAAQTLFDQCHRNPMYTDCRRNGCPFFEEHPERCRLRGEYPVDWDVTGIE